MNLLNSKSILDCEEYEEEIHNQEINNFLELLMQKDNYDCAVLIKSFDEAHKNEEPIIKSCKLYDCQEMLEYVDIKNGVDVANVDGYFTFITYGQCYSLNGIQCMVTQGIQIRPYDEKREFITLKQMA